MPTAYRINHSCIIITNILACLVIAIYSASTYANQARTALVVGNSNYTQSSYLQNPVNDARAVSAALESLGFTVILRLDATQRDMEDAIREFGDALSRRQGLGLFYYAGHGIQSKGMNYLLPIGTELVNEVDLRYEAVNASRVLESMGMANNAVNIVIMDACRDNPLGRGWNRSTQRGLARIDEAPKGTLLAYSTSPGKTAADGDGEHSPFTEALLEQITRPGLSLTELFNEVGLSVQKKTAFKQTPWISSSPLPKIYLSNQASPPLVVSEPAATNLRKKLTLSPSTDDIINTPAPAWFNSFQDTRANWIIGGRGLNNNEAFKDAFEHMLSGLDLPHAIVAYTQQNGKLRTQVQTLFHPLKSDTQNNILYTAYQIDKVQLKSVLSEYNDSINNDSSSSDRIEPALLSWKNWPKRYQVVKQVSEQAAASKLLIALGSSSSTNSNSSFERFKPNLGRLAQGNTIQLSIEPDDKSYYQLVNKTLEKHFLMPVDRATEAGFRMHITFSSIEPIENFLQQRLEITFASTINPGDAINLELKASILSTSAQSHQQLQTKLKNIFEKKLKKSIENRLFTYLGSAQ